MGRTGAVVPILGQGTWNLERNQRAGAIDALRAGLDAGMTHVDTAELYGRGEVEELVREAIAGRRDEVYLVTKVMPSNASRAGTKEACERSLRRLGTDRIDLYLLHWPGPHPLADTLRAFEELERGGKIRAFGLSNFDVAGLEEAIAIVGEGRIACDQVFYHLGERAIEHRLVSFCAAHGITVVAYSPFGSGDFPRPTSAGGKALAQVAAAHNATPHQVALRFLVRHPSVVTIPKASSTEHTRDNAAAGDVSLTDADLARIDAAFPIGREPRELPTI
jgi:diketogulonate reductase-like aldo/keto reductase